MVEDPTGFHLGLSYLSRTLPLWNPLWQPLYWRCFKTPDGPDDHDSAFFKLSASLYISQSWGSGPCRDGDNRPSGRHDLCWFPHNGFEIPLDEDLLASSLQMILLKGACQTPGLPRVWAPPGHHFIITHHTVLSGSLSEFLLPLLGLWAYSLCLRNIYDME